MFSWYKYLIVSLFFSHLGFWSGSLFLIAPFPDVCLLVLFSLPFYYLLWRPNMCAGDIKDVVSHFLCKSSTNTCVSPPSCHWGSNPGLVILCWKMLSKFAYRCRIFYVATCHRNRTEWHAVSPSPSYCMKCNFQFFFYSPFMLKLIKS